MSRLAAAIGLILLMGISIAAAESGFERSLKRLGPSEQLIQLCDFTAMKRIRKEHRQYRPDRAVADARSRATIKKNTIEATGGAFRSRHKWYALSYVCTGSPDTLKVLSFKYKIGAEIPESKWATYSLWQ